MISDSRKMCFWKYFSCVSACGKFRQQRGIKEIPNFSSQYLSKESSWHLCIGPAVSQREEFFPKIGKLLACAGGSHCHSVPVHNRSAPNAGECSADLSKRMTAIISKAKITPVSPGLCRTAIRKCNMALYSVLVCVIRSYLQPWRPDSVTK